MSPAELVKRLLAEQDLKYRDFHASLLPNIDKKSIIGVRVPTMRKIAKEFASSATPVELDKFLDKLPHKYFEENQVHLFVVERIKDFDECVRRIEQFLPYIDNWALPERGRALPALRGQLGGVRRKIPEGAAEGQSALLRQDLRMAEVDQALYGALRREHADGVLSGRSIRQEPAEACRRH